MKVLIVVDMQYDFIDGALGTPEARAILPLMAETIEQMADPDTVVIFTKDTHQDNYMNTLEGKNLPVPHCIDGTHGHTIHDEVFNMSAWGLESGKSVEINISWVYGYGQLESGKYRIVKEIFKSSSSNINNNVSFNVYADFEINEEDYVYEKATATEIELKTELETMNHGNSEDELVKYKTYVKNNKLYANNLKTNEEKIIFDKEPVKNIAIRNICCAGNAYLLILTSNGNVYMSNEDSNYGFILNIKFNVLMTQDMSISLLSDQQT
jgi:hypothetical protein